MRVKRAASPGWKWLERNKIAEADKENMGDQGNVPRCTVLKTEKKRKKLTNRIKLHSVNGKIMSKRAEKEITGKKSKNDGEVAQRQEQLRYSTNVISSIDRRTNGTRKQMCA